MRKPLLFKGVVVQNHLKARGQGHSSLFKPSAMTTSRAIVSKQTYKYTVLKGNNAKLVERVLSNRYWWSEGQTPEFKWTPCSIRTDFGLLSESIVLKRMVNHFENHRAITRKNELL